MADSDVPDATAAAAEVDTPPDDGPDATVETGPLATAAPPDTVAPADVAEPAEVSRVVSLSATHTEMMFAIGAGDLLVAVDEASTVPAEASDVSNDLPSFDPDVEQIAAFEPDLVLIAGDFTGLGGRLDDRGIEWWDGPPAASLDDTYAQIAQLGAVTGNAERASEVIDDMQTRIDGLVSDVGDSGAGLSFYHEVDASLRSIDSTSFVGQLYSLLGLRNIADGDIEGSESFGRPQLDVEFIVEQNPDIIFVPNADDADTVAGVAARDGWDPISAVQNGLIFEIDGDVSERWGPGAVDHLESVAAALVQVESSVGG